MIVFDGKNFATTKESELKLRVEKLPHSPKLVSILVGNDKASLLYTNLKEKAAKKVGINFIIKKFPDTTTPEKLISEIEKLNNDTKVNGLMVQLPLPANLKTKTKKILNTIDKNKDVDGHRANSKFMPAAVRAVKEILEFAVKDLAYTGKKAAVVGGKGVVGAKIVELLEDKGYKVCVCDKDTRDLYAKLTNVDLIVSATGTEGLIKAEMVKEGVIAIDVGAPVGDLDPKIGEKAIFYTPVPGGVGPVTITCLLENLVSACENN